MLNLDTKENRKQNFTKRVKKVENSKTCIANSSTFTAGYNNELSSVHSSFNMALSLV